MMNQATTRKLLLSSTLLTLFILTGIVTSSEVTQTRFNNQKDDNDTSSLNLKLEARSEENNSIDVLTNKTNNYLDSSESRSNIRKIKSSTQDSYLDALEYSHSSNNPREGIVKIDVKTKPSKLIRRTYDSPVYRPHSEYGPPDEPITSYGPPISADEKEKIPRIVYGAPHHTLAQTESFHPTPSNSYSVPVKQTSNFNNQILYGSGNKYDVPPRVNYGNPSTNYGVPSSVYGPALMPQKIYGPPHNNYLPASQPQQGETRGYGSPQLSGFALPDLTQLPSLPSVDFSFPLAFKLNAYTIAKIILKLVIFKMIVKFIAVLCLLLFIPKLEMKKEENDDTEDDDTGRKLIAPHFTTQRLNNLTSMILESIEMYNTANALKSNDEEKCTSVNCRMRGILRSGETWNDYLKLFNNYVNEEENIKQSLKKNLSTKNE